MQMALIKLSGSLPAQHRCMREYLLERRNLVGVGDRWVRGGEGGQENDENSGFTCMKSSGSNTFLKNRQGDKFGQ